MTAEIAALDVSFRRKSIIGYTVGLAVYVLVVVALYPSFKNSADLNSLTKDSPGVAALFGISGSLTSPTGWINANVYANFFPLILLMLTIGYGAACLAGQEKDGHLELVLSAPFSRTRVTLEKVAALAAQAGLVCVVTFLSVLVGHWFELSVSTAHLATATLGVLLLGLDFGLLALAIGAGTGNRGMAIGIAVSVAAASYLVSSMAGVVSWLGSVKYASLFFWSVGDNQLEHGLSLLAGAVLGATAVVLAVIALRLFSEHDLTA
ncbi:MAG: ABC transporter permease [Acidimicrobiia bacterium]|nr:ABC transporter permease [Acidimicrobiia bacterium]